jgi:hypothetical protein
LPISAIFCPFFDALTFLDQHILVVRVGREIGIVVLDDHQLAIAAQAGAAIDDLAAAGGQHAIAGLAG